MSSFQSLGVAPAFLQALEELKIKKPSPIQEQAIPVLMGSATDFIGQAQTGTGKTIAFGLPLLQKTDASVRHIQTLILSPTRELCQQIHKQLFKLTKFVDKKIFIEAVFGGEKIEIQMARLSRPTHVVVATPGRLMDLLQRKVIDISKVKTIVLDEADEMLSMGFQGDIDTIMDYVQGKSKTWLFSATMPPALKSMMFKYMREDAPSVMVAKKDIINQNIEHQFFICKRDDKIDYVREFIRQQGTAKGLIFARTISDVEVIHRKITADGTKAEMLHGDLEQRDREKAMRAIKGKRAQLMIATDVSARGIDVENLAYVVHYQLPDNVEYYTHRAGRTARAGRRGISICFITQEELKDLAKVEKELHVKFIKL